MLLAILVILLVLIGVYLAYQKDINTNSKIVIAVIAVIIFNVAYTYMKRGTESFVVAGGDDDSYDIEVSSPDFSQNDDGEPFQNKDPHNESKFRTTAGGKAMENLERGVESKGLAEVASSVDYEKVIKTLQAAKPINISESFDPSIMQKDVNGTGNVFSPQVIIRNNGGTAVNANGSNSLAAPVAPAWQVPTHDLWQQQDSVAPPASRIHSNSMLLNTNGGGQCIYTDPMNVRDTSSKCGTYKEGSMETPPPGSNLVEANGYPYAQISKIYFPGYSFSPPSTWDVPQKRPPVCLPDKTRLCPSGVFDHGTPTNVLELNADGTMCMTESECTQTNVGSLMPKFEYHEIRDY